ncbi:MAG: hypothetical protein OSA99_20315, partial [Acidimicrobiales bacterium]|nr:hypothetical protein [Acidimicrobiales bacterium]
MTSIDTPTAPDTASPSWGLPDLAVAFVVAQVASAIGIALLISSKGIAAADFSTEQPHVPSASSSRTAM